MASGGDTSFTLAVATEGGAAEQLNQIIAAWVGTADRGVPLEMVEVEHATKYALDVRNKETGSSLVARFRNAAGEVLLSLVKEAVTIGKPTTFSGAVTFSGGLTLPANAVDSDNYVDGSIDREHLAADVIDGTKLADDAVDSEHYVDGSIDTAHVANNAIGNTKFRQSGGLSVVGKATPGTGNVADMVAASQYRVFGRAAAGLGFFQVSNPMIEDNAIDDTKAGNRVPQFYRRQGGSATNWSTPGTTTRTPTTVRQQAGAISITGNGGLTFPQAFSQPPVIFLRCEAVTCKVATFSAMTANGCTIYVWDGIGGAVGVPITVHWHAEGPE